MIFPNNNKAAAAKISRRMFAANKVRNVLAIIAIILTTTLFTSLFTLGTGITETMQRETMRQAGGSAHASLKYLNQSEYDKLKTHPLIKQIEYSIMLGMSENPELLKHHTEIRYATDGEAKLIFSSPTHGRMPLNANEAATDTTVLDLLGIPHKLGQAIDIQYKINNKLYTKKLMLSGFWEGDSVSSASMIFVSKTFVAQALDGIKIISDENGIGTGDIFADIMFRNSFNIENNLYRVITDSGYSIDEKAKNHISYGVNWAYMSTNMKADPATIAACIAAAILILFAGYLIIYNIFQISVIKDIQFYGLLKTIGTTSKQIKSILLRQSMWLSAIGIPLGLIAGFLLGKILLPVIMNTSIFKYSYVSLNPFIFIGSSIFSLLTVYISCRRPGKTAGRVSPIEALRYNDTGALGKKALKSSMHGGKIYNMALSNLGRSKKKTVLTIMSLSLSLILFNSVFTVTQGFDMNKFVSHFMNTDFVIGHANYFNSKFNSSDDEVSESFIKAVSSRNGITGGRVYYYPQGGKAISANKSADLQLYGLDDFPLKTLSLVRGSLDKSKLSSGKYIIEGIFVDDNGRYMFDKVPFALGKKVTLKLNNGQEKDFVVAALIPIQNSIDVRYYYDNDSELYLPTKEFKKLVTAPIAMSYIFNVEKSSLSSTENFLKSYTTTTEKLMNYESRNKYTSQFISLQKTFITVGSALSLIIGMLGILNFINTILTGIITRQREFAMLESIGMTKKQLVSLLMCEGLFYALSTIAAVFLFGSLFSLTALRAISENLWFFSYRYVILPAAAMMPILILISLTVPALSYFIAGRQSIIQRLR